VAALPPYQPRLRLVNEAGPEHPLRFRKLHSSALGSRVYNCCCCCAAAVLLLLLLQLLLLLSLLEESPASPSPLRSGSVGCIPLIAGRIRMTVGSQQCYTGHEIL